MHQVRETIRVQADARTLSLQRPRHDQQRIQAQGRFAEPAEDDLFVLRRIAHCLQDLLGRRLEGQQQVMALHGPGALEFRAERAAQRAVVGDVEVEVAVQLVGECRLRPRPPARSLCHDTHPGLSDNPQSTSAMRSPG